MKIASIRPNVTICFAIFVYFLQVAIEMINNRIAKLVSHRTKNDEIRLWIDWNSWLLSAKWWTQNQKHLKRMHRWSFQNLKDFFFWENNFWLYLRHGFALLFCICPGFRWPCSLFLPLLATLFAHTVLRSFFSFSIEQKYLVIVMRIYPNFRVKCTEKDTMKMNASTHT